MTPRSCGDAFWGAAVWASLYLVLLVGCANTEPVVAQKEDPQTPDPCEYRSVFVEFDNPFQRNDPRVEPLRRVILNRAAELFPELGLVRVADPSDAYWRDPP
jgi:hypothetical protein